MSNRKIKRQYKAGKTNYQERLKVILSDAINYLKNGNVTKFSIMTWAAYKLVCIEQDRKEINQLVKKRLGKDSTILKSMHQFKKYVNANPFSSQSYKFQYKQHRKYWFEIYNLMREALTIRYAGTKTTLREEDMQEGLDEGPDDMPDDLESTEIDLSRFDID